MANSQILSPKIPQAKDQVFNWKGLAGCGDSLALASAIKNENRLFVIVTASVCGEQGEVDPQRVDGHDIQGLWRRPQHVGAAVSRTQKTCGIKSWILGIHFANRV